MENKYFCPMIKDACKGLACMWAIRDDAGEAECAVREIPEWLGTLNDTLNEISDAIYE